VTICVVMPAFNEGEGIQGFLLEIARNFPEKTKFIVVDDFSNDDTHLKLVNLSKHIDIEIITNEKNIGHGPSTLRALKAALDSESETIVAVDGDGQFSAQEIFDLYEFFSANEFDIAEGVRRLRLDEPWFRSFTSYVTRRLVRLKSGRTPQDANTPLRIYKRQNLSSLLDRIDPMVLVPNLMISIICRVSKVSIGELHVTSFPRRGASSIGDAWKQKIHILPSKRFLMFCIRSSVQILSFKPRPI
jgi:dolichol-phosphate mannosyltransferase